MEKQVHPPKMGAIGTNVPKNTEEKEEDFLETIFSRWRSGKTMRLTDFAIETGENKAHLRSLAKRLVNHRYIEMTEGVRGQIRYQKKQNKKNINRSVLLISDTCGQRETSGRIDVVSTIESKGRIYMKLRVSEDA